MYENWVFCFVFVVLFFFLKKMVGCVYYVSLGLGVVGFVRYVEGWIEIFVKIKIRNLFFFLRGKGRK